MTIFNGLLIIATILFVDLIINYFLINYSNKKFEKYQNKIDELEKDNRKCFEQISGLLNTSGKTIKLIQKFKNQSGNKFQKIDEDLKSIMRMHNDLVDIVYESFANVYCDLNEEDCSICEYYDRCSKRDSSKENGFITYTKEHPSEDSCIACNRPISYSSIIIDPNDKDYLTKLKSTMYNSGVPEQVISHYLTYIKALLEKLNLEGKYMEIAWNFKETDVVKGAGIITNKPIDKNEIDKEKLIDPNSKIVKSLNKLYKQD